MKKVLSVIGLIALIGITTPVFADPGRHAGHNMHSHMGGRHIVHSGHHHGPHHIRPHHGVSIHAGYPRHSYWYNHRFGHWRNNWCDYRLGWCDVPPVYYSVPGIGLNINF